MAHLLIFHTIIYNQAEFEQLPAPPEGGGVVVVPSHILQAQEVVAMGLSPDNALLCVAAGSGTVSVHDVSKALQAPGEEDEEAPSFFSVYVPLSRGCCIRRCSSFDACLRVLFESECAVLVQGSAPKPCACMLFSNEHGLSLLPMGLHIAHQNLLIYQGAKLGPELALCPNPITFHSSQLTIFWKNMFAEFFLPRRFFSLSLFIFRLCRICAYLFDCVLNAVHMV